nr:PREDICTED: target of rapamycin complex subunit LST8 [Opisthocomus hoazin]
MSTLLALSVPGWSAGRWSSETALCWGTVRNQNGALTLKTGARLRVVLTGMAELIVGDQSGAIHIWDLKTDHNEQLIPEPEVSVNSVHIDPDASYMAAVNSSVSSGGLERGLLLATCSADQTCKIWRTSNFSLMTELSIKSNNPGETSRGWMWDCAFSGDSQYIVTASSDNLARLWCVETGEIKREYSGHQKAVVCLAFNDSVLG